MTQTRRYFRMFKTILFPTDFSDVSRKAVKYIKQLKGAGAQEVVVLHVIDERELAVLSQVGDQYVQLTTQLEEEIEKKLTAIEADMAAAGFRVKLKVVTGNPFREIMAAADEKVSVIVLGSHGRSNVAEMLMGSVSENVIRHAKVPVLVVSREV
jgi:nucleotide-binding universal stress UspA family protein